MTASTPTSRRGRCAWSTVLLTGLATVVAACAAVNTRPYLTPLPDAIADTLPVDPGLVIAVAESVVTAAGLRIRTVAANEGYLETAWHRDSSRADAVRLRFFSTAIGESLTELLSEAVIQQTVDPSMPARENEAMVPAGHWGEALLKGILEAIAVRFGRAPS